MKKSFLLSLILLVTCLSKNIAQSIRKDYREFTGQEVTDYNNALQTLFQQGVVSDLANHHASHFGSDIHAQGGNGSQFLTWHRFFILDYEYMLRGTNSANNYLTLPYWDWTTDNSATNSLFWDNYFLLRSNFTSWGVTRANTGTLPTQANISTNLGMTTFYTTATSSSSISPDFSHRLEHWHNLVHGWVGGTMNSTTSPLDPIFYLHHNMVDKIWQQWEDALSGIQANLGSFNTTGLVHWTNILNNQMFDSRSIPRPPSAGSTGRNLDVWYARAGKVILDGANGNNFAANDVTSPYIYRYTAAVTHGGSAVAGKMYVGDVQYDANNNVIADNKGGFSIENGVTSHFRAGGSIEFKPGFIAKGGCTMTAKIISTANGLRTTDNESDLKYDIHPIIIKYDHCTEKSITETGKMNISLSPNPATSDLVFSYTAEKNINNAELSISDVLGRIYSRQTIDLVSGKNNKTLDIRDLSPGIYILYIIVENRRTEQIKFVKQ